MFTNRGFGSVKFDIFYIFVNFGVSHDCKLTTEHMDCTYIVSRNVSLETIGLRRWPIKATTEERVQYC